MKETTALILEYQKWLKENWIVFERTPFTSNFILELDRLRYQKEREIIKALFSDLPSLNEFIIERSWGALNLVSINQVPRPFDVEETDESRSWYIEINLRKIEVEFLTTSLLYLTNLWEGNVNERSFTREEF